MHVQREIEREMCHDVQKVEIVKTYVRSDWNVNYNIRYTLTSWHHESIKTTISSFKQACTYITHKSLASLPA